MIPRQAALDFYDRLMGICNFNNEMDWNQALDLRQELKEWDETTS
jgi:hypothetical protein